jgi:hypothetical protein
VTASEYISRWVAQLSTEAAAALPPARLSGVEYAERLRDALPARPARRRAEPRDGQTIAFPPLELPYELHAPQPFMRRMLVRACERVIIFIEQDR